MTNHFIYLNSGPMVKDLFFNHGGGKFKPSHFAPYIGGLNDLNSQPNCELGNQFNELIISEFD